MKYSFKYDPHDSLIAAAADELEIKYNRKDATLLEFLEKYKEKRINIYINYEDILEKDLLLFKELKDKYNIVIETDLDLAIAQRLKDAEIPFFFSEYIVGWDELNGILDLGVTDVYIVEELCFELDKVAEIVHQKGARVRVFPNVAQSSWKGTAALKKFFIRPEDVDAYEPYIDTFEFWDGNHEHKKNMDIVLHKVYAIDKKWFGKLNEIIYGLDCDIDSRFTIPRFAEMRIKCNKRCIKGGSCNICDNIYDLSKTLEKAEIMVKIDKK